MSFQRNINNQLSSSSVPKLHMLYLKQHVSDAAWVNMNEVVVSGKIY